ncbi:MAG: hypothetical protein ACFFB2_11260 [Promethearchaeota archaeon]
MRVIKIVLCLCIMFSVQNFHPLSVGANSELFLIPDGTIVLEENTFFLNEAVSDPFGIEWVIDYSITEEVLVTSLSSSIVKFEKDYTLSINDAYQKRASVTYFPTHYGVKFLDDDFYELADENASTFSFRLTRNVNKYTGERVLAQNPYGATHVILLAFYDSSEVYSYTWDFASSFGAVGSLTNVFDVNVTDWEIGQIVDENFTVSGENVLQGYETWVLERNTIPEGYTEFTSRFEYEKTSGLYVKGNIQYSIEDNLYYDYSRRITNLAGLIDDGYPTVSAPPGQIVDSSDPVEIIFEGIDNHFDHYNLYQNGSLYETNDTFRTEWSFFLTPTSGNSTWTFEIVDTLGYSANATTWLMFSNGSDVSSGSGFGFSVIMITFIFTLVPLVKKRRTK